ncbi:hypothetical protein H0H92_001949 [Tricholoma furcatifolium]|nr:hypothetical protein H0H92_001949 [Tricholoma furcatifolium]
MLVGPRELHLQIKLIELQDYSGQASQYALCNYAGGMDFIIPVNRERHEMVGNIILSLSTLASAFRLKAPLPPYLPPAENSRQRLVDAIRKLDIVRNRDIKGSRQLLFFAYAHTMKGVTEELEFLGRSMQDAFGVIGGSAEEFEALFMYPEDRDRRLRDAA